MKLRRVLAALAAITLTAALLSGCGSASGNGKNSAPDKVRIGIITPMTGVLAGFGEGTPWTEELVVKYVNDELGGIYFKEYDKKLPLEIIYYDSESDTTKCTELAQKLITDDKVDLIIARHTPETVNPVSAVCERMNVPCLAMDAPVDAWLAEGPYEWSALSHWNLDTMYDMVSNIWKSAGVVTGAKIGLLFPNDADGTAWANIFTQRVPADGYTMVYQGQYPSGTQDFSQIIGLFKSEGVEIVSGMNTNPDFATFWRQCGQLGFKPKLVTMGKAILTQSDAESIGADLMDGVVTEVWWSPVWPYTSALTGETPASLAEKYLGSSGRIITPPMGIKYAAMEVAIDVLQRAGSLDKTAIRDALFATDIMTVNGRIKYNDEHYCLAPIVGGQWLKTADGGLEVVIIDNSQSQDIPVSGSLKLH